MNVIYTDASDRIFPVFSFFFRGVVVVLAMPRGLWDLSSQTRD